MTAFLHLVSGDPPPGDRPASIRGPRGRIEYLGFEVKPHPLPPAVFLDFLNT
jgi:hypothetical protein